jgi:hypothetical protein
LVCSAVNDARKRAVELLESQQAELFPAVELSARVGGAPVLGLALGEAGLFRRALEAKPQWRDSSSSSGGGAEEEGGKIVEMMVSCVATLFLVQRCCDAGAAEAGMLQVQWREGVPSGLCVFFDQGKVTDT